MTNFRLAALGGLLLFAGCANAPKKAAGVVLDRWSQPSADAARRLMDQYGAPDDATPNRLTWQKKGPWNRTIVWNRPQVYRTPRDFDLVVQAVRYPVTREQAAELIAFSQSLIVDVERGELSSRASREELNFLNLNLADEVVRGLKTIDEAQLAYKRVIDLSAAGKSSPYLAGLRFAAK